MVEDVSSTLINKFVAIRYSAGHHIKILIFCRNFSLYITGCNCTCLIVNVISHPLKSAQVEDISDHSPGKTGDISSVEQKKVIWEEKLQNLWICYLRITVDCLLLKWLGQKGSY